MLELYFLLYRIPKMMSQAARKQRRSAVVWSLIGIGVWVFAQTVVAFVLTIGYEIAALGLDRPKDWRPLFRLVTYLISLSAAVISVLLVRRRLLATPQASFYHRPPPPPTFRQSLDA
jgi:hypothetical protein